ncbi:hypothetical protein CF640_37725, partial [Burkholderia pseudomallei]
MRECARRVRAGAFKALSRALSPSCARSSERSVRGCRHNFGNRRCRPAGGGITFFSRSVAQVAGMPATCATERLK